MSKMKKKDEENYFADLFVLIVFLVLTLFLNVGAEQAKRDGTVRYSVSATQNAE